jgi:hypothetical protein
MLMPVRGHPARYAQAILNFQMVHQNMSVTSISLTIDINTIVFGCGPKVPPAQPVWCTCRMCGDCALARAVLSVCGA